MEAVSAAIGIAGFLTPLGPLLLGLPWVLAGVGVGTAFTIVLVLGTLSPRSKFGMIERRRLRAYHRIEIDELTARLPIDGVALANTHEARLRASYGYVDPPFSGILESGSESDIVDAVTGALRSGQNVVLMGEPGSGKSLVSSLIFARLADEFAANRSHSPCPILLHLNAMKLNEGQSDPGVTRAEESASWLQEQLSADVSLPGPRRLARILSNNRVVLICDGLDEAPVMRSPQALTSIVPESLMRLFSRPSLLTSRTAFYSLYVDATQLMHNFPRAGELLPMRFEVQGERFVRQYAAAQGCEEKADELLRVIRANPFLKEAVTRPLILRMTAEVLLDLITADHSSDRFLTVGHGGETSAIYGRYVDKWLQREQEKAPSKLRWWQKGKLIQCVAWWIFQNSVASDKGWGHFELKDLLIEASDLRTVVTQWLESDILVEATIDEICREIANRSFLIISNDRRRYRFVHKSFFEFCVARHVVESLDERKGAQRVAKAEVLLHPLPDEVIDFIRELLLTATLDADRSAAIEGTFLAILSGVRIGDGASQLMAVQQAANLLPIVAGPQTMERLRAGEALESHPFLQRAVAVADALHHDRHELLDEFVRRMERDQVAEAFHMGYNRIYYGDQAFGDGQWLDDNHPACGRFFRATIRHLKMPEYHCIHVMDLYTLRALLRATDRRQYLLERERAALDELRSLIEESDPDLGPEYDRQRCLLLAELNQVLRDGTPQ